MSKLAFLVALLTAPWVLAQDVGPASSDADAAESLHASQEAVTPAAATHAGTSPEMDLRDPLPVPAAARGILTLGGGALLSASAGFLAYHVSQGFQCLTNACDMNWMLIGLVGTILVQPFATWGLGNALGGNGALWASLVGAAIGAVPGYFAGVFTVFFLTQGNSQSSLMPSALGSLAASVIPAFLSTIGYQLSEHFGARRQGSAPRLGLVPMLVPTRDGGAAGLAFGGVL